MQIQYQGPKRNNQQPYKLQIQSTVDDRQTLQIILQRIFSNQYIYVKKQFRKKIKNNKKGYIHLQQLLKIKEIIQFFQKIQLQDHKNQLLFIKATIKQACNAFLHLNFPKVRRIVPFNHHLFKQIKPLSLQKLQNNLAISDIRELLDERCFSTTQNLNAASNSDIKLIYSNNYRNNISDAISQSPNLPFKILEYHRLCMQRQRQSRFWHNQQIRTYQSFQYQKENIGETYNIFHRNRNQQVQYKKYHQIIKDRQEQSKLQFYRMLKQPRNQQNNALRSYILSL